MPTRALFALGTLFAGLGFHLHRVEGLPHARGLAALVDLSFLVSPPAVALGYVLLFGGALSFASGVYWRVGAGVMAGVLAMGSWLQWMQWPPGSGSNHAVVFPGAAMVAMVVAALWADRQEDVDADAAALDAACGIAAATYTLAGFNKLFASGVGWASGTNLALHITIHAQSGVEALRPMRLWVAEQIWICWGFGVGTILIECTFLVFVVRRLRLAWAIAVSLLHVGIGVVMGLHHYDWMFCVLALGFATVAADER